MTEPTHDDDRLIKNALFFLLHQSKGKLPLYSMDIYIDHIERECREGVGMFLFGTCVLKKMKVGVRKCCDCSFSCCVSKPGAESFSFVAGYVSILKRKRHWTMMGNSRISQKDPS
jgi:hypothetical protein